MTKQLASALIVAATLSFSGGAFSASKTDSNYLSECKQTINAQYANVSKIDVASINSRRNLFKAKLRVRADGERSLVSCVIKGDEPLALNCLKGNVCKTSSIASN